MFHCFMFQLYNYFEDGNYVYLILEMCHNGEMSRYIKNRKKPFSEDEGKIFFFFFLCCSHCINLLAYSVFNSSEGIFKTAITEPSVA